MTVLSTASWPQSESQPRPQSDFQRCGIRSQQRCWTVPRFLRSLARQRKAAIDGAPYPGEEDCSDRPDRLEEGGKFRRQTFETTSSLSVSGKESVPSLETIPGCGHRVLETLGFEGKYQPKPSGQCVR